MPKVFAVPLEEAQQDFAPTLRTVQLITYLRCTGRGIEGDPLRYVHEAYTTDGRLVYSVDPFPFETLEREQDPDTRSPGAAE